MDGLMEPVFASIRLVCWAQEVVLSGPGSREGLGLGAWMWRLKEWVGSGGCRDVLI